MSAVFERILIPLDFSINTDVAVKKALDLIEPGKSKIYLLHLQKNISKLNRMGKIALGEMTYSDERMISKMKLRLLEAKLEQSHPETEILTKFKRADTVQDGVIEHANEINPDLIIIGKHSRHPWMSFLNSVQPNTIAKATGSAVLTVKPGAASTTIKSIVVPVAARIPKRKIELIVSLKKKFPITVHLITIKHDGSHENDIAAQTLLSTYRILRHAVECPIAYEVLHGDNVARSVLSYAQKINADMLLVQPDHETRLGTYPDRYISDELKADSRLQIMTIQS